MSRVKTLRIGLCIGIVSAFCQTAGGELITPTKVTASTSESHWPAIHLIDDSGLSAKNSIEATHAEATDDNDQEPREGNAWVTPHRDNYTDYYDWATEAPVLTFELGGLYAVDGIVIWNYSPDENAFATTKNCAKFITLAFGVNGSFGDDVPLSKQLDPVYENQRPQILYFGRMYADTVRMTIIDNWYGYGDPSILDGGDRVGLSEIKFLAPEPGSFVLLLGFGFAILLVRCCRAFWQRAL